MVSGRKDRETHQETFLLYPSVLALAPRYSLGDDIIMFSGMFTEKRGLLTYGPDALQYNFILSSIGILRPCNA